MVLADPIDLGEVPPFRDLDPDALAGIKLALRHRVFPRGTAIMTQEQPGEVVYIILEGTVQVHVHDDDGTQVILAVLPPGELVGEMSVIDSLGRSATVVTREACRLLWLDRPTFWDWLRKSPIIAFNLAEILSRRLRLANVRIESLATLDVYSRVARQILAYAQEYGEAATGGGTLIPWPLTQGDLAGLVGASRVRVNQVLVSYKRREYLSVDRRHRITVHDQDALARRCR